MARNPFEETARAGGRPGYQSPTNYTGESPQFSRGNLDVRYPVDSAVQQAHNRPSNRQPLLNQPPMEGPPQRPHVNPRMRHINPRGMGGGLGGLRRPENFTNLGMLGRPDLSFKYSHMSPNEGMGLGGRLDKAILADPRTGYPDNMIRGTWRRMEDARRADEMDEYGYLEGAPRQKTTFTEGYMLPHHFNEMYGGVYDDAIFRTVDPNTNRIEQYPQAGESEQAGLWQDIKRILKNTKNPGPLIDQWTDHWNEQQTADASGIMEKYNQFTDKFGDIDVSGEGIEYEKDFNIPWGGTGTIEGQYGDEGFGGGLNFSWPLGQRAGMDTGLGSFDVAYRPGTYGPDYDDDDYGPFNPPSVYEMDDDWLYDPDKDEYEFDYKRGNLVNTGLA